MAAARGLCSANTTSASANPPQRACLALHLALLGASAARIKETPRLAARYPERYFREQCAHRGKVIAAIAGLWRSAGYEGRGGKHSQSTALPQRCKFMPPPFLKGFSNSCFVQLAMERAL